MKLLGAILVICMAFSLTSCKNSPKSKGETGNLSGNITISGAFALYPMTVRWAEEFQILHPKVKIDISAGGAGKGMADALSKMADLGMFSRAVTKEETEKGAWHIAVTKDAVLPTINMKNPLIGPILKRGITQSEFKNIFLDKKIKKWNELIHSPLNIDMNVYTRSDACGAAQMWAQFLQADQEDLLGTGVYGDPGMADAVKNDKVGIGYNNVIFIYDIHTRKKYDGLEVIPIDLNNDGQISPDENFYHSLDTIMGAIKNNIYPSPPARELYFVSKGKPERIEVIEFIKWILADGQKYVSEAGYVQLAGTRIEEELTKLRD